MANFWSGEDSVFSTNQPPVICDPTTSHGIEESFSSYPKIDNVWSTNNPTNLLTPQPAVVEGEDEGQEEPLPPLKLKVQLPSRASFLANGVHQLELVLLYGHLEEHVLMIHIHGPMMGLPIQKPSETEIPITENSATVSSVPSFPSPILNQGAEESLNDPLPPPRKKITALRRRKMTQSTTCKTCHKIFANKSNAATHSFLHLSQEEKEAARQGWKNKCYFCPRQFRAPSLLFQHLVFHTKEKAHPCDKCRKQFAQKSDLTTHQRLHNPATLPLFHCEECDKSFTRNRDMTRHVTTVHRRLKRFQCPQCDKKFGQKIHLTTHLNSVHLGIRYPCRKPNCGKTFSEKGYLRQHEKTAH